MNEMKALLAQVVSCCVCVKPIKVMQHMHGIITYMFEFWANLVVHLLILKSSMAQLKVISPR